MRKRFMLMLVLLLSITISLSACGTDGKKNEAKDTTKTLRVVTAAEYAPFEYMDKGEVVGFDVDLVKAVAKKAGYKVNIEHVGWEPIFVEIKEKRADFTASAITINDDRKESYDFASPYFLSTNMIMVKKGSDIKTGADLKDKKIAVQNGTTGQEAVEKLLGANHPNIKKFENIPLGIMELKNGGVDAVVADNTVVEEYVKNNPNDNLVVIEDESAFEVEFYGFLFPKGSKMTAEIDVALKTVLENGTYSKLYKKWFGVEPDLEKLKAQQ